MDVGRSLRDGLAMVLYECSGWLIEGWAGGGVTREIDGVPSHVHQTMLSRGND
jgi:hypothetical protein